MEFKKDNIIYIKCTIGNLLHLTGHKVKILKVNKKDDIIYSLRCLELESFRLTDGFIKTNRKHTYRLSVKAYEIFDNKKEFLKSCKIAIFNMSIICNNSVKEMYNNFT